MYSKQKVSIPACIFSVIMCTYIYMCVCMYYMYVMYVYVHCTHVYIYIYVHTHTRHSLIHRYWALLVEATAFVSVASVVALLPGPGVGLGPRV